MGGFYAKLCLSFPGQGAQYAGMGQEFARTYPSARAVFQKADEILGFVTKKFLRGQKKNLKERN